MKFFILTDLEGVAGVDRFLQTRGKAATPMQFAARKQLAREVNACVAGIRDAAPGAEVTVWDGHGSGGLDGDEVCDVAFLGRDTDRPYCRLDGYSGLLFVGQHAMAGAFAAPLCHTYSSREIVYYRLNGVFVGEFAARALLAGVQGVPTIYLSGDDKAACEARCFVPGITTTIVKYGTGLESADHLSADDACAKIRQDAARAVLQLEEVEPFRSLVPPYRLEMRGYEPMLRPGGQQVDAYTVRFESDSIFELPGL